MARSSIYWVNPAWQNSHLTSVTSIGGIVGFANVLNPMWIPVNLYIVFLYGLIAKEALYPNGEDLKRKAFDQIEPSIDIDHNTELNIEKLHNIESRFSDVAKGMQVKLATVDMLIAIYSSILLYAMHQGSLAVAMPIMGSVVNSSSALGYSSYVVSRVQYAKKLLNAQPSTPEEQEVKPQEEPGYVTIERSSDDEKKLINDEERRKYPILAAKSKDIPLATVKVLFYTAVLRLPAIIGVIMAPSQFNVFTLFLMTHTLLNVLNQHSELLEAERIIAEYSTDYANVASVSWWEGIQIELSSSASPGAGKII